MDSHDQHVPSSVRFATRSAHPERFPGGSAFASPENNKAPLPGAFLMERTGIEPVTSGLQSRRSPS
jgi:hypothetical protein